MGVINQHPKFNAINKQKDSRNISNKKIKDSSSRPRMCGTLMLWIAEEKMKKKRDEFLNPNNKKVAEL